MAHAIRVRTRVRSQTLRIQALLPLVGKMVDVIVIEDEGDLGAPDDTVDANERLADGTPSEGSPANTAAHAPPRRELGAMRGLFSVPDDFDDPLPEDVLRAFEGEAPG